MKPPHSSESSSTNTTSHNISSLTPIHHHHVLTWWTSQPSLKHITIIVISLNPIHHIYYNRFKQPLTLQLHSNQFTTNSPQNTSLPLPLSLQIYQLRNHQHTPHHLTTTTRPSNRFLPPQKQLQYHSSRHRARSNSTSHVLYLTPSHHTSLHPTVYTRYTPSLLITCTHFITAIPLILW